MTDLTTDVNPRPPIMFADPRTDPRNAIPTPTLGDERNVLLWQLRWLRMTLEMKCDGLTAEQLADRAVPPSTMSLLGMIRHSSEVERRWFRRWMAAEDVAPYYYSDAEPEGDFDGARANDDLVAEAFTTWRNECDYADRFIEQAPSLDVVGHVEYHGPVSLRETIVHVIQEYARHVGHADLFREVIDGKIGI
jgi:hypothetical protein